MQKELNLLLDYEDMKWKQCTKWHWYKEGDKNTKFFQAYTNHRMQKNHISNLFSNHNEILDIKEDFVVALENFIYGLFQSSSPSIVDITRSMSAIEF